MPSMVSPCRLCGCMVEFDPEFAIGNGEQSIVCDRCISRDSDKMCREVALQNRLNRWFNLCPRQYLDTDVLRLPCQSASKQVLDWHPNEFGIGLNIWGHPNTGKTRSMLLTLKRNFMKGMTVTVMLAGQFETELSQRAWHRSPWVENLCRVDILAFDDFDKCAPLSRDHEKILFSVLDRRMSAKRPVLLTHNSTAQVLEYKFKNGEALVRRIRDFTRSVFFNGRVSFKPYESPKPYGL